MLPYANLLTYDSMSSWIMYGTYANKIILTLYALSYLVAIATYTLASTSSVLSVYITVITNTLMLSYYAFWCIIV